MFNDLKMFINGQYVDGQGQARKIKNPNNNQIIAEVNDASTSQVEEAVCSAQSTFIESEWSTNKELRIQVLRKVAELIEESAEELSTIETLNTGKPIKESKIDLEDCVSCFKYYADLLEKQQDWKKEMPDGTLSTISQEPIGVCALIVPWNFPLLIGVWKIAPALAAGNTLILKPSELTPLTAYKLTVLLEKAGLPAGVFNLIFGSGDPVGQSLITQVAVDKVSFTGGTNTGKKIYQECAGTMKRISLECGGKSPLLVFDDADIDIAVDWALFGSFFSQGQVCVASSRLLVHEDIYTAFIDKLKMRLEKLKIGDPLDKDTEMGPLISPEHLEKVKGYIKIGLSEGAHLLTGGERISGYSGNFITPAVFINVQQKMRIVQEEIFGPVVTIQTFTSEEEAIKLANDTKYGLAAGVLSNDLSKANRVANNLRAGTVWINGYHIPYVETMWGGFKQSSIGRELGPYGLAAFSEAKHINTTLELKHLNWYAAQ
ncbi:aldehyde dehydrogenase family protein [Peribacillus butanolivorans]|uniref:aldehyde dehydrogenase family protein n=1 Tax=Peribacillus butanolivorans TaxID=421767 RepID=UPI0035DA5BF4